MATELLPTWQARQLATALEGEVHRAALPLLSLPSPSNAPQIRQLQVAMAELDTVRPKKATFVKRANVFFLDRRDAIVKEKRAELQAKEQRRHDLGLQLRGAAP